MKGSRTHPTLLATVDGMSTSENRNAATPENPRTLPQFLGTAFACAAFTGQGGRDEMQDRLVAAHVSISGEKNPILLAGVFDGHGGSEVAELCVDLLPQNLKKVMEQQTRDDICYVDASACYVDASELKRAKSSAVDAPATPPVSMKRSRTDPVPATKRRRGIVERSPVPLKQRVIEALPKVFEKTHKDVFDILGYGAYGTGTTASLVVITEDGDIITAHSGDSRIVAIKGSAVVYQTWDHNHLRQDETTRIEMAGGKINELGYVNGLLNMTRAIGDYQLAGHVIPTPEIGSFDRDVDFIVLASDGLWNFVKPNGTDEEVNREVAHVTNRIAHHPRTALIKGDDVGDALCRVCASVLAKRALDKGRSRGDNVAVIVIRPRPPQLP